MTSTRTTIAASIVGRTARRVVAIVRECNDATLRLGELRADPARYVIPVRTEPLTYAQFLDRTAGELAHESAAATRIAGMVSASPRRR